MADHDEFYKVYKRGIKLPEGVTVETSLPFKVEYWEYRARRPRSYDNCYVIQADSDEDGDLKVTIEIKDHIFHEETVAERLGAGKGDCIVHVPSLDRWYEELGEGGIIEGYYDTDLECFGVHNAVRGGCGDGNAVRTGDGIGTAYRCNQGTGDAIRHGGDGKAERLHSGAGNAIRSGAGLGYADRTGPGHGGAYENGVLRVYHFGSRKRTVHSRSSRIYRHQGIEIRPLEVAHKGGLVRKGWVVARKDDYRLPEQIEDEFFGRTIADAKRIIEAKGMVDPENMTKTERTKMPMAERAEAPAGVNTPNP